LLFVYVQYGFSSHHGPVKLYRQVIGGALTVAMMGVFSNDQASEITESINNL
jgi:Flp pilus assembly protein protease CpaA